MKKYALLFCILCLLSGCSSKKISFPQEKMTQFSYQETNIVAADYEKLLPILNEISWKGQKSTVLNANIVINTEEEVYYLELKEDKILLQYKEKFYYTKDKKKIAHFHTTISNILENYDNPNFYEIEAKNEYTPSEKDTLIRMDTSDHYIIMKGTVPLMNFKIHKIEWIDEEFQDIDLLYSIEKINEHNQVVIRTKEIEDIRISFENQYHSIVSIIMKREEDGSIIFQKNFIGH